MAVKEKKANSRLSDEEKEKLVIKLLNERKTYREIIHRAGVSPNFVSNVIKKLKGIEDKPPVDNQAIKMFGEGKRPIEVTIALQISTEETLQYYRQYQRLIGVEEIPRIMDILGNDLVSFVEYFKEMRPNFSLEHIKEASRIAWNMDEAINSLAMTQVEKERELRIVEKLFELRKGLESLNTQGNLPPTDLCKTRY